MGRFFTTFMMIFLLITLLPAGGQTQKKHPFSVHDLLAVERISDPRLSPNGNQVAFVLRSTDLEANKGRTDIWLIDMTGRNRHPLTTHPASDYNPCWTPDGKTIYFLSTRSGSSQVWRIAIDGGEASQITDLPLDVNNLIMSANGQIIAFSLEVYPKTTLQETEKRLTDLKKQKATGMIFDSLFIRHWDTWKDGRRSHIFVMNLKDKKVTDIMMEMDADSPSKPFGGTEEFTFTPDNKSIVFTARQCGQKEAWSTNFDLFIAPIDGKKNPETLTKENKAWDTMPVFSPNGKYLAYLAMGKPGFEADRYQIVIQPWPTGEKKYLAREWDRSPSSLNWSADSKKIYASAANLGQTSLFCLSFKPAKVVSIIEKGTVAGVQVDDKKIVYGLDHLSSPVELYSCDLNGKNNKKITAVNDEKLALVQFGDSEQFTFPGWNNETVYGYVVKPADFDPQKKYPVAFLIHGGPQGSFSNNFHYRWNPQVYTGAGYAVVMIDFHGSVGYGQKFTDAISGDWGGKPLEDLQKGLAAALEKYPWLDGSRVGALGASYGGYMINWIAGNWPDRFRCLVSHDGNLDERMAYYDTEELWFPEWEHGGAAWENPEGYEKHNPINYVKNWQTPMLVIHGALDFRVVETQGLSTFTALQRKGIPSKLLYFPDENHWVLKPHNSILWHETVLAWLDQWLKK